jgi:hypothetical protein
MLEVLTRKSREAFGFLDFPGALDFFLKKQKSIKDIPLQPELCDEIRSTPF